MIIENQQYIKINQQYRMKIYLNWNLPNYYLNNLKILFMYLYHLLEVLKHRQIIVEDDLKI